MYIHIYIHTHMHKNNSHILKWQMDRSHREWWAIQEYDSNFHEVSLSVSLSLSHTFHLISSFPIFLALICLLVDVRRSIVDLSREVMTERDGSSL